jgi:GTP cyclohydrolase IB
MPARGNDMNIHFPPADREPALAEAEAALEVLRAWAGRASDAEIAALDPALRRLIPGLPDPSYPLLSREFPADFRADTAYLRTLPDLQNGPASLIRGARARSSMSGSPISGCRSGSAPATRTSEGRAT